MPAILMNSAMVAALFVGTVMSLTMEKKKRWILLICSAVAAVLIGITFYVYGFTQVSASTGDAVFHSLLAVCKMFIGKNELAELTGKVELFDNAGVLTVFWIGHFLAFFVTSGTTISTLGSRLLSVIRTTKIRRGSLLLVYGSGPNAVTYAARQIREHKKTVLFVDNDCSAGQEANISALGALVDRGADALHPNSRFLKRISIRPGSRQLEVALFQEYPLKNLEYAKAMLKALEEAGIRPEQTGLILRGIDEADAQELLAAGDHYGYGNVYAFNEYEVAARLMIRMRPPCDVIRFDDKGRAAEDFRAVIVGFGRMGMAVLEQLIMNGQFSGSRFSVDVFDPTPQNGMLYDSELLKQYTVRFHTYDANSSEFYAFLRENACNYIVLATGDENDNFSLDASLRRWYALDTDLRRWYRGTGNCPDIILCTKNGTLQSVNDDPADQYRDIYNSNALDLEKMDRVAMQINQYYCKNDLTPAENWKSCDYFSRLSCRAAADFYPAVLKALGKTEEQVLSEEWNIPADILENLAVTEHLRWCAFHWVMGYRAMDADIFDRRAARYLAEKKEKGTSSVRLGKDTENRLHACLIPWDDLDALSEKENAITGKQLDYKQMDRDNVNAVPDVIRAAYGKN